MSTFKEGFEMIHDVIKSKWVPEILESIDQGNCTFNALLKSIPYLSHTELTRKLKFLTAHDLVLKDEESSFTYTLKPLGGEMLHIFYHLRDLSLTYKKVS